ncbi:hypothetical protein FB451DRAFT_988724, partial [Mycena latifolia]
NHLDGAHDTSYRIYQFAAIDDTIRSLPDPRDFDRARAAFMAALTRILCAALNARIEMGLPRDAPAYIADFEALRAWPKVLETPPPWAECIRPLDRPIYLAPPDDPALSSEFKRMSIFMERP